MEGDLQVNTINYVFLMRKSCILKMKLEFSERTLSPSLVFLFPPEAAFNITDVAEFPGLNRNGHLH